MKVVYVIDSLDRPGGAEQAVASMAPGLVAAGVQLHCVYLLDREGFQEDLLAAGARVTRVPGQSRAARVGGLVQILRAERPDLVHTTLYESDICGRTAAMLTRVPVVSSLVNVAYGPEHRHAPGLNPWKVRAAQTVDAATARGVRRFHALSHHVADVMSERLLVRRPIDVIPRGRDPARLGVRSADRRRTVRATLDLPGDVPMLLAAARHEHQKGLDVLLSALPSVLRRVPDTMLVIAGRFGTTTERLRDLACSGGVADAVRLLGPRTDVPDLLAAADVFVAPSRWEGLGSAVIEAMGVGTPIVASDLPPIRETLGTAGCAHLVPADEPAKLADAVVDALTDPVAAAQRACSARRRFGRHFTVDAVVQQMIAFYHRALTP